MLSLNELADGYDTILVAAPDVQGRLVGRRLPVRRFLENPEFTLPICTCALCWDITEDFVPDAKWAGDHTGWHDYDMRPDLSTLRPYPGVPRTAICLCDSFEEGGALLELAPRTILKRQVERAAKLGYKVNMASELEFYLFKGSMREARLRKFQDLEPTTIVRSDYSAVGQMVEEPFIFRVRQEMERAGIPIYACQGEYGLGQWEVNLEYCDALEMADRHTVYKAGLKELALQEGLTPTFMAKPVFGDMGSSGHIHVSLRNASGPVFPQSPGSHHMSAAAKGFLGGLTAHVNETALFFAQYVNSYKRHITADYGGGIIAWGFDNRTTNFRVLGAGDAMRIEHRYAGADVNPYLAMAAIIAAGLDGMEKAIDPGPPLKGSAYAHPELPRCPSCLGEAITAFASSQFALSTFGEDVVQHYVAHGRLEWNGYLKAVTDWERMRAFEVV